MSLREWMVNVMLVAVVGLGVSASLTGCKEETPATPTSDQMKEAGEDTAAEAEKTGEEAKEAAEKAAE